MNFDFLQALDDIEQEKDIPKEILIDALETALESAYKKDYGSKENVHVEVDTDRGEVKVYSRRRVVEEVDNENFEIDMERAQEIDSEVEIEDVIDVEITPADFGRIAAQTAKQVIMQRIREAERDVIYEHYKEKEGEFITGTIQRFQNDHILIDMGKTEALLPPSEQIEDENYEVGDRIKLYIVEVSSTTKGPKILVSRTHPGLLLRLFEIEIPEIFDGTVEIKAVAREAGKRSKVAVASNEEDVDAVGACVGPRGSRVQAIVDQLNGEKIDIVEWNPDPGELIANSLNPAEVKEVNIDEEEQVAEVVVPDFQLSLAIGKEGQNARLAAKLTGWKVDIKKESEFESGGEEETSPTDSEIDSEKAEEPESESQSAEEDENIGDEEEIEDEDEGLEESSNSEELSEQEQAETAEDEVID
ncbi:transcription termination factor NusA [Halarsenatibacter silvermanii]|uniref:Transcription termination/antitermination protein NusA n=1 Tax=Halarsenatibacter silvermanii TaxID=321763 RepID=A0A1G9LH44_9FIRM|nr:transcription termination factor NusA [Halarsenatibacter silvermanii]SDL61290.1 NusA antitermination factor [Halarsenatibacter silvermanii]